MPPRKVPQNNNLSIQKFTLSVAFVIVFFSIIKEINTSGFWTAAANKMLLCVSALSMNFKLSHVDVITYPRCCIRTTINSSVFTTLRRVFCINYAPLFYHYKLKASAKYVFEIYLVGGELIRYHYQCKNTTTNEEHRFRCCFSQWMRF